MTNRFLLVVVGLLLVAGCGPSLTERRQAASAAYKTELDVKESMEKEWQQKKAALLQESDKLIADELFLEEHGGKSTSVTPAQIQETIKKIKAAKDEIAAEGAKLETEHAEAMRKQNERIERAKTEREKLEPT